MHQSALVPANGAKYVAELRANTGVPAELKTPDDARTEELYARTEELYARTEEVGARTEELGARTEELKMLAEGCTAFRGEILVADGAGIA